MFRIALLLLLSVGAFVCEGKLRARAVRLGANPGAAICINRQAIDPWWKFAVQLMSQYVDKMPIPDMSTEIGGTEVGTKNLRISQFQQPVMGYELIEPNQLAGSLKLSNVGIQSDFTTKRSVDLLVTAKTQHDSGMVTFNITDCQINFKATIGEFENGIPHISNFECQASLGAAKLKVLNAKEQFSIDVFTLSAKMFRTVVTSQVCEVAKKLVAGHVNGLLAKIPNVLDINSQISIKFQLKPVVHSYGIEMRLFEKVITDLVSPFTPAPFSGTCNADGQVVIFFSDALLNDLLYQVCNNKWLDFGINKKSIAVLYDLIRLKCDPDHVACLGNVAPDMVTKYGADADVEFFFRVTKCPTAEFAPGKAVFTVVLEFDIFVTKASDHVRYHETTGSIEIEGNLKIKIVDMTAFAQIKVDKIVVHMDEEHNVKWEQRIATTIRTVVEQYINGDFLYKGLPLRLPFGFGLEQPSCEFLQNVLKVTTGFGYDSSVLNKKK